MSHDRTNPGISEASLRVREAYRPPGGPRQGGAVAGVKDVLRVRDLGALLTAIPDAWRDVPVSLCFAFPVENTMPILLCAACANHYNDTGPCDQGGPLNSPHRRGVPIPILPDKLCEE